MEQITVAGHADPIPVSPVAAKLLRERLEETRQKRGAEAADQLEARVGERIVLLLESGKPSIDLGNMRAVVTYAEVPPEEDEPTTGIGGAIRGIKEKLAQRGGLQG
ncbi:hypothetical protein [Brachybacterium muris]|uniref:Uncharacterized protein n=1 Tax=Brachybacterium muris UCD-AY4 TaxID=1249481 RepID=A0A022KQU9_9MICO|nr:hypothetical protein [Brachybacterium muris]EYT47753.1 hypothetical protein D641_0114555 [Brachybacterium muris UCD-AY4]